MGGGRVSRVPAPRLPAAPLPWQLIPGRKEVLESLLPLRERKGAGKLENKQFSYSLLPFPDPRHTPKVFHGFLLIFL